MEQTDPFTLFGEVFQEAAATGMVEPNSMALATADAEGRPSVRIVLMKGFDERGFVFYTNLNSRKGSQLAANPHAALCFYWQAIHRQVRVEGDVVPVTAEEADEYFASRARGSQIGAWASQQSRQLADREELLQAVRSTEQRFEGHPVPRPQHWSGFRLIPNRIEFWTAGEFRLHHRLLFERDDNGGWRSSRLYP
ncbi:MAG TPA: pyridoxamine 5'-phosphate oxidase [Candidatus Kapabacteria bacterium]|nr:pyridoxamine 5'-phosphate oxidase [Candidatus Kapabacteria bacterium]